MRDNADCFAFRTNQPCKVALGLADDGHVVVVACYGGVVLADSGDVDSQGALVEAQGGVVLAKLVEGGGQVVERRGGGLAAVLLLGQAADGLQVPAAQVVLHGDVEAVKAALGLAHGVVDVVAVLCLEGLGALGVDADQRVGDGRDVLQHALEQGGALVGR